VEKKRRKQELPSRCVSVCLYVCASTRVLCEYAVGHTFFALPCSQARQAPHHAHTTRWSAPCFALKCGDSKTAFAAARMRCLWSVPRQLNFSLPLTYLGTYVRKAGFVEVRFTRFQDIGCVFMTTTGRERGGQSVRRRGTKTTAK